MDQADTAGQLSFVQRLKLFTPTVAFLTFYLSLATLNFGYDVGTFSGVQAMTPFINRFGSYDETKHAYVIPSYLSSIMNSTPFIGKLIGALICGSVAERWGRKIAVLIMALISLVGVTLQTSATTPAQFIVGRIVNFAMTGFCIVVTPIYQAECAPADLRGMISSTIQFQILLGSLIASLVNLGTKGRGDNSAWLIPIGLQFVVPAFIVGLLPFMPESPRWLISQNRHEDALKCLRRLRKKDTSEEVLQSEIGAIAQFDANASKGSWNEIFNKKNRIRTLIAIMVMFFQQATGQAFVSQYSVVFYAAQSISNPFLLSVIQNIISLVCICITLAFIDGFGRRPILLTGGFLMGVFLMILGGVGTIPHPNESEKNVLVASIMLFGAFYALSWAPISYVILSEVASTRIKEITNKLAVAISVLTTFVVSFTVPYLLNAPYANLGAKVGFVYGPITLLSVVLTFFFVPEMKGRTLEEIDELFEKGTGLRHFKGAVTSGEAREVLAFEEGAVPAGKEDAAVVGVAAQVERV